MGSGKTYVHKKCKSYCRTTYFFHLNKMEIKPIRDFKTIFYVYHVNLYLKRSDIMGLTFVVI